MLHRYNECRILYPDGTDREKVYKFYRKNADFLITERHAVGLNHRAYSLFHTYNTPPNIEENVDTIAVYDDKTVAVCSDGRVIYDDSFIYNNPSKRILNEIQNCKNMSYVISNSNRIVGLRLDGTVTAVGDNTRGECNVEAWKNIVAIRLGYRHTVGLRANGTVAAVGENGTGCCNTQNWDDIVSIACGDDFTAGLRENGTVVFAGHNSRIEREIQKWRNITSIACGGDNLIGLCTDGTVVAASKNKRNGKCNVKDWRNIIAVSCSFFHTVGLRADGTVVAVVGYDDSYYGAGNVKDFRDVIAVKAAGVRTIAIKKDGTIISTDWCSYFKKDLLGIIQWRVYKPLPPITYSYKLF